MKLYKTEQPGYFYYKNKDSITYVYNYKDKTTKNTKRKKLLKAKEHSIENLFKAIELKDEALNENLKEEILKNQDISEENSIEHFTLNEIVALYRKDYYSRKERELWEHMGNISEEDFYNNAMVKRKLYSVEKFGLTYNKNVLNSSIGKMKYKDITKNKINYYLKNELNKKLALKSKFTIFSFLKACINKFIRDGLIEKNVFNMIKIERGSRQRTRYLKPDEIDLLLAEAKKYNKHYEQHITNQKDKRKDYIRKYPPNYNIYTAIYLGILTAGRASTVLNIKKKDINLKDKTIRLVNFKADQRVYYVPINDEAVKWFEKKLKSYENNEYLIRPSREHLIKKVGINKPMRFIPREVYNLMDRLFNQGIDKTNNLERDNVVNYHTLRRSIATNLALNNVSIYKIKKLLDHTTVDITEKYLNLGHLDYKDNLTEFQNELFKNFATIKPEVPIEENEKDKLINIILKLKNLEDDNFLRTILKEMTEEELKTKVKESL